VLLVLCGLPILQLSGAIDLQHLEQTSCSVLAPPRVTSNSNF